MPSVSRRPARVFAVQIANKYSDEDSPSFVNGVLQGFAKVKNML